MNIFSNFIEKERWEKSLEDLSHVDFSLFNEYQPSFQELNLSPINILLVGSEPNEYFKNHDYAIQNSDSFSLIMTWSTKILNQVSNSVKVVYGESWWQDKPFICDNIDKEFKVSFLRGNKLKLYGHHLRFELFDRQKEIKIPFEFWSELGTPGNWEDWREHKINSFRPYQYSICFENTSRENYFSEKITDCILNKTIPIYWGCSNIGDFYNEEGIIRVSNVDEAIKIINTLTPDYYSSKLKIIEENYNKAFTYKDYTGNISKQIKEIFELNNLL
jgi:hypothetical protein